MKPVRLRPRAIADLDRASNYYALEVTIEVALRFERTVRQELERLSVFPQSGSPHFGTVLNIPGLRAILTSGHPYTLFYVERDHHLDVERVLHPRQDIHQGHAPFGRRGHGEKDRGCGTQLNRHWSQTLVICPNAESIGASAVHSGCNRNRPLSCYAACCKDATIKIQLFCEMLI